jgi:hypothetical protein
MPLRKAAMASIERAMLNTQVGRRNIIFSPRIIGTNVEIQTGVMADAGNFKNEEPERKTQLEKKIEVLPEAPVSAFRCYQKHLSVIFLSQCFSSLHLGHTGANEARPLVSHGSKVLHGETTPAANIAERLVSASSAPVSADEKVQEGKRKESDRRTELEKETASLEDAGKTFIQTIKRPCSEMFKEPVRDKRDEETADQRKGHEEAGVVKGHEETGVVETDNNMSASPAALSAKCSGDDAMEDKASVTDDGKLRVVEKKVAGGKRLRSALAASPSTNEEMQEGEREEAGQKTELDKEIAPLGEGVTNALALPPKTGCAFKRVFSNAFAVEDQGGTDQEEEVQSEQGGQSSRSNTVKAEGKRRRKKNQKERRYAAKRDEASAKALQVGLVNVT